MIEVIDASHVHRETHCVGYPHQLLQRADDCLWRLAPGAVLVAKVAGPLFTLEGTLAGIWIVLDEPCTAQSLREELMALGVSSEEIDRGIDTLKTRQLLDSRPGSEES